MKLFFSLLFIAVISLTFAQETATVSGNVSDNVSKQPVVGAKIVLAGQYKALSDFDGNYTIQNVPMGEHEMVISMLSFDTMRVKINVNTADFNYDVILGGSQEIEEMKVIGNLAQDRKTPVAVSTLGKKEIQEELGSQDLPMVLNSKPGVHATQTGGGDGDARITIRGFDQRNVGVMIDGVPVNDMENGWVYWSNWFGLDMITSQIQVQRGLGATKLAMPSVGGTMNIITDNTGGKRLIKVKQEYGTGNFLRTSLSYKSGTLKNGWGILFAGSYKQGDGWVDALNTQGAFYYLKVQKKLGKHVLSLSGFGAPQQHGQRSYSQPIEYWDSDYARKVGIADSLIDATRDRGIQFNQHWGYRNGEIQNERRNYYHKPQITLKDFWKVNDKLSWSNMVYTSIGRGGGQRYFNSSSSMIFDENGQLDFDQIIYNNQWKTLFGQTYTTADAAYDPVLLKSSQILSASVNNHFWIGGLSQFDYKMNDNWNIAGGLDYRYYKGEHYNEVLDLLGGDYFVNAANENAPTDMKVVGDKIGRQPYHNHRDGLVQWAGGFGQAEYSKGRWTAFVNASTVTNFYKGIDYFEKKKLNLGDTILAIGYEDTVVYNGVSYDRNSAGLEYDQTEWVSKTGFTFKTGANFNVTEKSNVFMNVGYLSRTPQFSNVIDNTRNRVFDTLVNENIIALEVGYGFRSKKFSGNFNGYYTRWENRPLPFGLTIQDPNDPLETISVNVPGMDALHMGGEIDFAYNITRKIAIEGMVSIGDWTWQSKERVAIPGGDTIEFDARGVHVGNAAQSTYAAVLRYEFVKGGYVKLRYTYFDRYYSDFNPNDLTESSGTAGTDSWRIPGYGLLSLHAGYRVRFENSSLVFRGNVFNALNTVYISDARNNSHQDGSNDFDANSATVFIGQGLRFNVSVGFEF
jgi:iron complex outermembrane receptor protein